MAILMQYQQRRKIFFFFSHNDFPLAIRDLFDNKLTGWDFNSNLSENPKFLNYDMDHTDLPRLRKGHVGGQVVFLKFILLISIWKLSLFPSFSFGPLTCLARRNIKMLLRCLWNK